MTDHHIRIAFAVAGQAAFIFMYLMAIKETSRFKRNFVAWFGGFTWILFLLAVNLFAAKSFIEHDRYENKRLIEEALAKIEKEREVKIKAQEFDRRHKEWIDHKKWVDMTLEALDKE